MNKLNENKLKILLVEDNPLNQLLARESLSRYGHDIEVANNGLEGIEKFKVQNFDFVLMDINMPVMDGIKATMIIREFEKERASKRTNIIAVTANNFGSDYSKYQEYGMDAYLNKPYDADDLVRTMNLLNAS